MVVMILKMPPVLRQEMEKFPYPYWLRIREKNMAKGTGSSQPKRVVVCRGRDFCCRGKVKFLKPIVFTGEQI